VEQIKIHTRELELVQSLFTVLVETYEDGACFSMCDHSQITFKVKKHFQSIDQKVGDPIETGGLGEQILKEGKTLHFKTDRNVFGVRTYNIAGPIWSDDEAEIVGAWQLELPRLHKLAKSFDHFAPILARLLPEGGMFYTTDKDKCVNRQGSPKFDVAEIDVGAGLNEVSRETLKSGNEVTRELPASAYGIPTMVCCTPIRDEEDAEIVGTFGLILPRQLAHELKAMADNLQEGLTGMSSAMQQIAASSSEISQHQNGLHKEIEKVKGLTYSINEVMGLIKNIADETKMLGLNAAIEAARAGDLGRGFGVVAQEIRKLSDESKQTVGQIRKLTTQIHTSMGATTQTSQSVLRTAEESAAATEEVNASLEEITSLSERLDKLAADL
jgi:predicted  nucleic acid-binding Zn-ribbon protein